MGSLFDDSILTAFSISGVILLGWLLILGYQRLRQRTAVAQFRDSLGILASSFLEGHSFPCVLTIMADLGPYPLARVFRRLRARNDQGAELSQVLQEFVERLPCFEADYLARAVQVHPQAPEQVGAALVRLKELRENQRIFRKRVESASAFTRRWIRGLLLVGPTAAIGCALVQAEGDFTIRSKFASNPVMWFLLSGLVVCALWFVLILQRQDEAEIVLD